MAYTEQDMQDAIGYLERGWSLRKIRTHLGIPPSTLQSRIRGRLTRREAFEPHQALSASQEARLTQWALAQRALGRPPTHEQIREFACRILSPNSKHSGVGKSWVRRFLRRNPVLKVQRTKRKDTARDNGPVVPTADQRTDLRSNPTTLTALDPRPTVRRYPFRKVEKASSDVDIEIARLRAENEALKAEIEKILSVTTKSAEPRPNLEFRKVSQIYRNQIEAGRIDEDSAEESGPESGSESDCSVASCILARGNT